MIEGLMQFNGKFEEDSKIEEIQLIFSIKQQIEKSEKELIAPQISIRSFIAISSLL
jgi:hypothetical protein